MLRLSSRCLTRQRSPPATAVSPVKEPALPHNNNKNHIPDNYFTANNALRPFETSTTVRSNTPSAPPPLLSNDDEKFMLILGKPGGGKGTISSKILRDFPEIEHVSTGDILRRHVREGTQLGKEAQRYMSRGDLVPDGVMIDLVMEYSTDRIGSGRHLLLDGFPRTMEQARALDEKVRVGAVVDLDIPSETIVHRIADRWIHPPSGRVYNYSYNPPIQRGKDDQSGEDLVQRDDDKPTTVRKRLEAYDKVTLPLIDYYEKKGVLKTFSGTMSDKIYPEVKKWLNKIGL